MRYDSRLDLFSFVILFHKSRLISSIDQNHGACPTNSETCSHQSSVQRGGVSPRIGKVITQTAILAKIPAATPWQSVIFGNLSATTQ